MIDLHCHILPQIDDGSDSFEESIRMVRLAEKNRIDVTVATPHFFDYNNIEEFVFERNERAIRLNDTIKDYGYKTRIACGAEVYLDGGVFTADNMDELTVNKSRYMLCEFTLKPFDIEKAVIYTEELINRGYTPIIAHPERYISFMHHPEIVNDLWDMGCRFQVNASSLAGRLGEEIGEFCHELVLRGFVDFIGTDAHSSTVRKNDLFEKIDEFPEDLSEDEIEYMTMTAPLRVLKNEVLDSREVKYF